MYRQTLSTGKMSGHVSKWLTTAFQEMPQTSNTFTKLQKLFFSLRYFNSEAALKYLASPTRKDVSLELLYDFCLNSN